MNRAFQREVRDCAKDHDVPESLIWAICKKESNINTWAARYEPKWNYFLPELRIVELSRKNSITKETERIHQSTSWGLMQVMGTVARELGYEGPLTMLLHPEIGLEYGAKKIKALLDRYGSISDAVAAYNAGIPRILNDKYVNQSYVDDVLKYFRYFQVDEPPEE